MIVTKQGQDRNKPAATIGFWAALLTAVLNLWFVVAFIPYLPILNAPGRAWLPTPPRSNLCRFWHGSCPAFS